MKLRQVLEDYTFILPAVGIFTIFYIIPFFFIFRLSLFEWDGIGRLSSATFVGLANFKEIIFRDSNWWRSVSNAGWITFIALTFQNSLAFLLALACSKRIVLRGVYRIIFFIPPILSEVVVGMVWRFIINDVDGANIVNQVLACLGLHQFVRAWLSDPHTALNVVALVHSWKGFGWAFLIFLAGLQTIPREFYEAAWVDGANSWQVFKNITFPLLVPVIILVAILTILGTMQSFVLIISLVGGELAGYTSVPVLRILWVMRNSSRFGYACALGINLGIILVVASFIQYKFFKKVRNLI